MQTVLNAIAEPHRRKILTLVRSREMSAGEIASHFRLTRPAISQHLGILASSGLVTVRREGTRRLYHIREEGFRGLRSYLMQFWQQGLQDLKVQAEREQRRVRRHDAKGRQRDRS